MRSIKFSKCPGRVLGLAAGLLAFGSLHTASAATYTVDIINYAYTPNPVTINVNDTVNWIWEGDFHSTTSSDGLWDSGVFNTGYSYSYTFTSPGSFPYYCSVHFFYGTINVQAAVAPPTVQITSPTNGEVFLAPATIDLAATATNSDGSSPSVEFLEGTTPLGTFTNAPYSVMVSNLAAGSYTFSAVATSTNGLMATNSVSMQVVTPTNVTVTITNPSNGVVYGAPANVTVAATASVTVGTVTNVQFFANGSSIGSATASPFMVTASNLAVGAYSFTAVATGSGVSGTSAAVGITVANPVATTNSSQTLVSLPNFIVTTPPTTNTPSGFEFDVNGVSSGQPPANANVNNSPNFTLNAGATYVFTMNTAPAHPIDFSAAPTVTNLYGGASAQAISSNSPNTTVTLSIPPTNYPPLLYYICSIHKFYGIITIAPPLAPPSTTILQTSVASNIVLSFSGGTNTISLFPQFASNLVDGVWLSVAEVHEYLFGKRDEYDVI